MWGDFECNLLHMHLRLEKWCTKTETEEEINLQSCEHYTINITCSYTIVTEEKKSVEPEELFFSRSLSCRL